MSAGYLPPPQLPTTDQGRRICQVIKVRPDRLDDYKRVHATAWPEVLSALRRAHIVDYSINYFAPLNLLIAHMRYIGDNFEADMETIKDCPVTRRWWELTDRMQESFVPGATGSKDGPWWADCEEVFRMEG